MLRGCDEFLEHDHGPLPTGRRSLEQIATDGTALAGRWIWYDSAFSRDDDLMDVKPAAGSAEEDGKEEDGKEGGQKGEIELGHLGD